METLSQFQEADRLAITLRPRIAKIVFDPGGGVATLFIAYDHHRSATEPTKPAHNRLIIGKLAVAVELNELFDQTFGIVDKVWPFWMAGDLGFLPGVQLGIGLGAHGTGPLPKCADFDVHFATACGGGQTGQLFDLGFELSDRALKLEVMRSHSTGVLSC